MIPLTQSLDRLEARLQGHAQRPTAQQLAALPDGPEWWPLIGARAVFGEDLLSFPPDVLGWDSDYSKLFRFLPPEQLANDAWQPGEWSLVRGDWYPIGDIDGGNWILYVQDTAEVRVAAIDHEEVHDDAYFARKTSYSELKLPDFIDRLQLQTVTCLMDRESPLRYSLIEMLDGTTVTYDRDYSSKSGEHGTERFPDSAAAWEF